MPYNVGVIGTGYVGLVTGTCFAESGNDVLCIDIDADKVQRMKQGEVPIYEPGLEVLFQRNIRENRLKFSTNLEKAVTSCSIFFLCLPTPPSEDGSADLQHVLKVAEDIGTLLDKHDIREHVILVDKSTVPVGTSEKVTATVRAVAPNANFSVVSNPEFLKEGFAVDDFMKPDRVVVGTSNEQSAEIMRDLYEPFTRNGNPIFILNEKSAEVCKYAANAHLAMRISFMNELANYCEEVGANIDDVRYAIGSDSRIGKKFLYAGVGYGGSCFPKDVRALLHSAKESGIELKVVQAVEEANAHQKSSFLEKIRAYMRECNGSTVAVWGLAFKPNTDDTREAPAFTLIDGLLSDGYTVQAYDPEAFEGTQVRFGDRITYATDMYAACSGADVLVLVTEWSEFRNPDFNKIEAGLNNKVIFDGRNVFSLDKMADKGYRYHSIGRPALIPEE